MFLNEVMEETRKIYNSENGPIWATPENLPFFKDEILLLFSYSYGSKVPKWKCAHILLCKKYKNSIKLLKIADLQPPDWIQRKKSTLYETLYIAHYCIYQCGWQLTTLIFGENSEETSREQQFLQGTDTEHWRGSWS